MLSPESGETFFFASDLQPQYPHGNQSPLTVHAMASQENSLGTGSLMQAFLWFTFLVVSASCDFTVHISFSSSHWYGEKKPILPESDFMQYSHRYLMMDLCCMRSHCCVAKVEFQLVGMSRIRQLASKWNSHWISPSQTPLACFRISCNPGYLSKNCCTTRLRTCCLCYCCTPLFLAQVEAGLATFEPAAAEL